MFVTLGGFAVWQNCRRLLRDKQVRGADWRVTFFMTVWGLWDCWFFPLMGLWVSFAAGIVLTSGNLFWVVLAIRYRDR